MRQYQRITFRSLFRIKIYEQKTGELVGYVIDVSDSGLRMRSDIAIPPGETRNYRIKTRKNENENIEINIHVNCIWSQENFSTGHIESGFTLLAPNDDYKNLVEQFVSRRVQSQST